MSTQLQVEALRLQGQRLHTLLDRVLSALTSMKRELAMEGTPSFAAVAAHMDELEEQSKQITEETVRFQSFSQAHRPQRTNALEAAGEPLQSFSLSTNRSQWGRYKIVCTLDGKEPAVRLYGQYVDQESRTFTKERYAMPIQTHFIARASGMRWDAAPPIYEIVPV